MATLAKATAHNGYIDNDGWRTRTRSATFIFTVRLHGSNLTSLLGPERYREELTAVMRRKPWAHWVASVKDMPRPSPSMGDGMKYVQYHKLHVLPWLKNVDFMAPLDASAGYAREMDLKHRRWQGNEEAAEKELQHYLKHPELQRPKRVLQRLERKEREARRRTAAQ